MAYQGLKNDPYAPTFNPGWGNHSSFSWNNGPNKAVLTKYGGLPTNLSQTMPRPNYQGFSKGSRLAVPHPMVSNAQSQPAHGYSELNKYERRIKNDMKRMLRENNERMLRQ